MLLVNYNRNWKNSTRCTILFVNSFKYLYSHAPTDDPKVYARTWQLSGERTVLALD